MLILIFLFLYFQVEYNDPEYFKLAKIYPQFSQKQSIKSTESIFPDDDLSVNQIYNYQDFSFTNAAKAKITNWLTKNMSLKRKSQTSLKSFASTFGQFSLNRNHGKEELQYETQSLSIDFSDEEEMQTISNNSKKLQNESLYKASILSYAGDRSE